MKFQRTARFKRMYKKLGPKQREAVKKALRLMAENIRHPSLRVKRLQGTKKIWEASARNSLRITFERDNDLILLRNSSEDDKTLGNP